MSGRKPIGLSIPHRRVEDEPRRQWVSLTEEEIEECFKITPDLYLPWHIYKRIEAKLREKNQ